MGEIRMWKVRSNSFRPDYGISGDTLASAIERNFERIARDARLGGPAGYRLLSVSAEYRPDILRGRGGVELSVQYTNLRSVAQDQKLAVVWISASFEDMPERREFRLRPGEVA